MCSEYTTKISPEKIAQALGGSVINKAKDFEWGKPVKFFTKAPVVEKTGQHYELIEKIFPTSPMPNSRLSGIGNQSDANDKDDDDEHTQIKRIYEMPRWKEGFAHEPLLIPMSGFTEFAYWGDQAGTAQNFSIPGEEVLFAAGIAIKPFAPAGEKGGGFSILTHTATAQMQEYHHRLIVLLRAKHATEYLAEMTPQQRFDFLLEHRYTGRLEVSKIRNMAKGWDKRIETQIHKRDREEKYCAVLKKEGVVG